MDSFSGRQGEWGPGTLPLGFTTNHISSELAPTNQAPVLTPLSWNISSITSTHPFGGNDGFSFNNLTIDDCLETAYNDIKDRKGKMIDGVFVKQ